MKGLNLTLKEFRIQLKGNVLKTFQKVELLYQNACLDKLHPGVNNELVVILPRKFRELRALLISSWYLPNEIKFQILSSFKPVNLYYQGNLQENLRRNLQISLMSTSEEVMINWLMKQNEFDTRQLFGTILREDLERALLNLKIYWKYPTPARRLIRRKGYRDKGTWKRPDRWMETSDISFTEYQNQKENDQELFLVFYLRSRKYLESEDLE